MKSLRSRSNHNHRRLHIPELKTQSVPTSDMKKKFLIFEFDEQRIERSAHHQTGGLPYKSAILCWSTVRLNLGPTSLQGRSPLEASKNSLLEALEQYSNEKWSHDIRQLVNRHQVNRQHSPFDNLNSKRRCRRRRCPCHHRRM